MSSKYKVRDHAIPHFITITVVGWVDGLSRPEHKDILLKSMKHCQVEKGLMIHAWVIMSNHAHLIISEGGEKDIPSIVRDSKKYTSTRLVAAIDNNTKESRREWMMNMFSFAGARNNANDKYQFWQEGYHPVALDTEEKWRQRMNYLHDNPVRAGLVWRAEDYKYSSAIDYIGGKNELLDIVMLY
jgi:putative transposase